MPPSKQSPDRFPHRRVWGFVLLSICLFLGLGVFSFNGHDIPIFQDPPNNPPENLIGPIGAWMSFGLLFVFGVGAFLAPVCVLVLAGAFLVSRQARVWPKALWGLAVLFGAALLGDLHGGVFASVAQRLQIVDTGGILGHLVMRKGLIHGLSEVGAGIVAWTLFGVALVFFVGLHSLRILGMSVVAIGRSAGRWLQRWSREQKDRRARIEKEKRRVEKERRRLEEAIRREERQRARTAAAEEQRQREEEEREREAEERRRAEERDRREPEPEPEPEKKTPSPRRQEPETVPGPPAYELPPLTLLDELPSRSEDRTLETDVTTTSKIIVDTLAEFGIEGTVDNVERGPVVTRYELLPAPGIRVERIANLANNLALALKATSVRVQAPIPGKGVVGIEVPNRTSKIVYLREVLSSEEWHEQDAHVPIVLGQDVGGTNLVADLSKMPHLLIAGATGAGKTVCMNAILASLLMSKRPDELRLLLVDPKIVEFAAYNRLPHLVVPVISEAKKVGLGLRWAITEMENRYKLFRDAGVRNIESYNSREIVTQEELFGEPGTTGEAAAMPARLPHIVIIIDELGDLMQEARVDIENGIARLAQLSRAVGIHMILSTQRPSVNVITGTIKANFPARIAFQVAQKVDSRTILDQQGADKLLGSGDMLFLQPGTSKLIRAQGAMVKDHEIVRIVGFIKEQAPPGYEMDVKERLDQEAGAPVPEVDEDDEMLPQAITIIRETRRASTSSLQRRLRIGYTRAARIMDILEERRIVGPPRGSEAREILIDLDGDIPDNAPQEETG